MSAHAGRNLDMRGPLLGDRGAISPPRSHSSGGRNSASSGLVQSTADGTDEAGEGNDVRHKPSHSVSGRQHG